MNWLCIGFVFISCVLVSACNSTPANPSQQALSSNNLTQQQASERQARISEVSYHYQLDISHSDSFSGQAQIEFTLNDNSTPLTLDLAAAQVSQFRLNGRPLYPNYNEQVFTLPSGLLNRGANQISLHYQRQYSDSPDGLFKITDPQDNQHYLYSFLKPASAKKLFPLFDQPDIRGRFTLTVTAPQAWQVISTTPATRIQSQGPTQQWQFAQTETISPYQFSLHAGPFTQWQQEGTPKLGLYIRQSQAQLFDDDTFLVRIGSAIDALASRLDVAYPFAQYNYVLVPQAIPFAMESSATNLINEADFWQQQGQQSSLQIMSDLTRQWFGNLVAIKWWDQQWLNESMALYMSSQLSQQSLSDKQAQGTFAKQQAYNEDRLVSSHALQPSHVDTNMPLDHVDDITRQKGLSSIGQLNHLIGDRAFYQGIKDYLTEYRFQSASSDAFINTLSKAAKTDLQTWYQQWVLSSGLNSIKAEYQCENNRISRFVIHQRVMGEQANHYKRQRINIGLFTKGRSELHRNSTVAITYDGPQTEVKRLVGSRCPDLVYPNYQDWGYVNVELDSKSLQTALFEIGKLKDAQLRSMLWQGLWDSVLQGELSLPQYLGAVVINLPKETQPQVLQQVFSQLQQAKIYLEQMQPMHQRYARQALNAMEQMSLRLAMQNLHKPLIQALWFEQYVNFATSLQAQHHLANLLNGSNSLKGIELDQQTRWTILTHLSRYDYPRVNRLLRQEQQFDNSHQGALSLVAANASQRSAQQKRRLLTQVLESNHTQNYEDFQQLAIIMQHLYPSEQKALSLATADERLSQLSQLDAKHSYDFMKIYSQFLLPMSCSYNGKQKLTEVLTNEPGLSRVTQRGLKLAIQAEQQCITISERMLKQ
ncbi:aminopeptidase N [Shewanella waksmanii]|uniref:aminopeptidase N n=1 Tax=Shewanella waksmanii TaxID=213783 RepID=UPI0037358FBB